MINFTSKPRYDLSDLIRLVHVLRAPGGCPWDAAQTHLSIRRNFLEEAYEACEGFDTDDAGRMCEELGDVLLQVLFHTDIEREAGRFTLDDVCDGVCKKLVFRHPRLFGNDSTPDWDELKRLEKGQQTDTDTLNGVSRSLPALWRCEKILKKAAGSGADRESLSDSLDKLDRESASLRRTAACGADAQQALGELLLAAVHAAAILQIDPEQALHDACERFIGRFSQLEQSSAQSGRPLAEQPREALSPLWNDTADDSL